MSYPEYGPIAKPHGVEVRAARRGRVSRPDPRRKPERPERDQAGAPALASVARERSFGRAGALHHLGVAYDHPRFMDLAANRWMVGLIARAVTVNIHLYHSHLDIHPPEPADDAWRWHEDGGRMTADLGVRAMLSVKVAYFLTDLETAGLGNLMVIPGSHRWTEPLQRTPGRQPDESVAVLATAGDAVLMERRVWHARSTNTSDRTRVVVFSHTPPAGPSSVRFRPQSC